MTAVTAVAVNGVSKAGESRETAQVYCPPSEVSSVLISIWLIVTFPSAIKGYTVISSPLLIEFPSGSSHIISGVAKSPSSFVARQLIVYVFPAVLLPTALVDTLKAIGSNTTMERKNHIVINDLSIYIIVIVLATVVTTLLSWLPYGLVTLQVYSLPWMVSLTGSNSSSRSCRLVERATTWPLYSHSMELTSRSEEQVREAD